MNCRVFIAAIVVALFVQADACVQKFKRAAEFDNFTKTCFMKAGFTKVPTLDEITKSDFDFKCAAKCIMGAIEVIDDQGKIDKDALSDFLGENAPEQTLLKLTEVSTACVESSERISNKTVLANVSCISLGADQVQGTKQGTSAGECNAIQKFYSCFLAAADKFC